MLERLDQTLIHLPALLDSLVGWRSLDIDYHPPRVERLVRSVGASRLSLHRIHPCEPGQALFHPHRWPCAVVLLSGRYEMGVGWGPGSEAPPVASRLILGPGARYEMCERDAWHYVRPLDEPVVSVMLSGEPWHRPSPRPNRTLGPLSEAAAAELLADVSRLAQFAW